MPTFNAIEKGTDVAQSVGGALSSRPVRVGSATRQQIVSRFGQPYYRDEAGRRVGYAWTVKNGVWVYPFSLQCFNEIGDRGIELDFDEHDLLAGFKVVAKDPSDKSPFFHSLVVHRPPFDQAMHPNNEDIHWWSPPGL